VAVLDNSFTIRLATSADLDAMTAIWLETAEMLARADHRMKIAPNGTTIWRDAVANLMTDTTKRILVADRRGTAIGYLVGGIFQNPGFLPERSGLVYELAVDAHGKAGGIGRELVAAFWGWLHEQGITDIEARVPVTHPIAQAFWRASGATILFEHMRIKG
jgi:ribosomal protein S18 acetylase RimI-like enzyme